MKITALVENQSSCELKPKHGLSLYIETRNHKILFDLGPDRTLFDNAEKRNISLADVDTVVISHGHLDHGGALGRFLAVNDTARVYVQKSAFLRHTTKVLGIPFNCGISPEFQNHPQVTLLEGDFRIDDELQIFTVKDQSQCRSTMNDALYEGKVHDPFLHEQHLIIREDRTALIMGCGHGGVVNILRQAQAYGPQLCVGGYHLMNPNSGKTVPESLLDEIAGVMNSYRGMEYYTCHCTGKPAFQYLAARVPTLHYLSCGQTVVWGEEGKPLE